MITNVNEIFHIFISNRVIEIVRDNERQYIYIITKSSSTFFTLNYIFI